MGRIIFTPGFHYEGMIRGENALLTRSSESKLWSLRRWGHEVAFVSNRADLERRFGELEDVVELDGTGEKE